MSKTELAKLLSKNFELSNSQSNEIIKYILETIKTSLTKNKPVAFIGFGTFSVKKRPARKGRNPRTGEAIKIPARKVIRFSVGKALKDKINKK